MDIHARHTLIKLHDQGGTPFEAPVFQPKMGACVLLTDNIQQKRLFFVAQVKRARLQALEYKRQYGSPMPSRLLTLAMADAAQV